MNYNLYIVYQSHLRKNFQDSLLYIQIRGDIVILLDHTSYIRYFNHLYSWNTLHHSLNNDHLHQHIIYQDKLQYISFRGYLNILLDIHNMYIPNCFHSPDNLPHIVNMYNLKLHYKNNNHNLSNIHYSLKNNL